jgi:FAD:protein FMN transferase
MTRKRIGLAALVFGVGVAIWWWQTRETVSLHRSTHLLMGTIVEMTLVGKADIVTKAENALIAELKRVEMLFSFHRAGSKLAALNDRAGEGWVRVDPEVFGLIVKGLGMSKTTGGAYDPSVGPLCRLWNFSGAGEPRVPREAEISEALGRVGWQKVGLDPERHAVSLPLKGMALDLGGIAKGYALDRAAMVIKSHGISSALVNAGGDIVALGERSPGRKWRLGVQDPLNRGTVVATVEVSDRVVMTSGDYERAFQHEGRSYHHILVPGTGYPAVELSSVTILGTEGVTAEPLGTGAFVLGPERGIKQIEAFPGNEGFLITSKGEFVMTEGARKLFQIR